MTWIIAARRTAVAPVNGAFRRLSLQDLAAPVIRACLADAGLGAQDVDEVILSNALGAGGNPARLLALHAGLPERCAAYTVDTQCCAGLDAVALGVGLITSGQAEVVVAGGAEAWSRSPIRMHRPLHADDTPVPFDRPAFAPTAEQDPDMLLSAARYAAAQGFTRSQQEAYALQSHQRAVAHQADIANEIVPIAGVLHDTYPRLIDAARAARMPVVAQTNALDQAAGEAFALSALTISAQSDGAALVLLMSPTAAKRLNVQAEAAWIAHASVGASPDTPLLVAELAAHAALKRTGLGNPSNLQSVELHDAFAVQGLSFAKGLGLNPAQLNARGGGLARGHPIGASAAIALVRLLANLQRDGASSAQGLVAVAGAGGLGSAAVVARL